MRIEIGKYYNTSRGKVVGPMERSSEGHYYVDLKLGTWFIDGTASNCYERTHEIFGDIVSLLTDTDTQTAQGPIREVRRREIVDGEYGVATVENYDTGRIRLYLGSTVMKAEDLRELSHLFSQLAEVLEEQP